MRKDKNMPQPHVRDTWDVPDIEPDPALGYEPRPVDRDIQDKRSSQELREKVEEIKRQKEEREADFGDCGPVIAHPYKEPRIRDGKEVLHHGVDVVPGGKCGDDIFAPRDGTIKFTGPVSGYGNTIFTEYPGEDRGDGTIHTTHGHLSEIYVKPGDEVKRGQKIGKMGNTGTSTGKHLHEEEFIKKNPKGGYTPDNKEYYKPEWIKDTLHPKADLGLLKTDEIASNNIGIDFSSSEGSKHVVRTHEQSAPPAHPPVALPAEHTPVAPPVGFTAEQVFYFGLLWFSAGINYYFLCNPFSSWYSFCVANNCAFAIGNPVLAGRCMHLNARNLEFVGNIGGAINLYNQSLYFSQSSGDAATASATHYNLGMIGMMLRDYRGAVQQFIFAENIAINSNNIYLHAYSRARLGDINLLVGDLVTTRMHYLNAMPFFIHMNLAHEIERVKTLLAVIDARL
jgi:hypothetical protein